MSRLPPRISRGDNRIQGHHSGGVCQLSPDVPGPQLLTIPAARLKAEDSKKKRLANEKRKHEAQKREIEALNRKHLSGLRVIQRNLVYVTGLNPRIREDELLATLRGEQYFGQYGKILKIVVNKRTAQGGIGQISNNHHDSQGLGVYVTFSTKNEAEKCIAAVDGSQNGDRTLRCVGAVGVLGEGNEIADGWKTELHTARQSIAQRTCATKLVQTKIACFFTNPVKRQNLLVGWSFPRQTRARTTRSRNILTATNRSPPAHHLGNTIRPTLTSIALTKWLGQAPSQVPLQVTTTVPRHYPRQQTGQRTPQHLPHDLPPLCIPSPKTNLPKFRHQPRKTCLHRHYRRRCRLSETRRTERRRQIARSRRYHRLRHPPLLPTPPLRTLESSDNPYQLQRNLNQSHHHHRRRHRLPSRSRRSLRCPPTCQSSTHGCRGC
jgi:hypothetical protein